MDNEKLLFKIKHINYSLQVHLQFQDSSDQSIVLRSICFESIDIASLPRVCLLIQHLSDLC